MPQNVPIAPIQPRMVSPQVSTAPTVPAAAVASPGRPPVTPQPIPQSPAAVPAAQLPKAPNTRETVKPENIATQKSSAASLKLMLRGIYKKSEKRSNRNELKELLSQFVKGAMLVKQAQCRTALKDRLIKLAGATPLYQARIRAAAARAQASRAAAPQPPRSPQSRVAASAGEAAARRAAMPPAADVTPMQSAGIRSAIASSLQRYPWLTPLAIGAGIGVAPTLLDKLRGFVRGGGGGGGGGAKSISDLSRIGGLSAKEYTEFAKMMTEEAARRQQWASLLNMARMGGGPGASPLGI